MFLCFFQKIRVVFIFDYISRWASIFPIIITSTRRKFNMIIFHTPHTKHKISPSHYNLLIATSARPHKIRWQSSHIFSLVSYYYGPSIKLANNRCRDLIINYTRVVIIGKLNLFVCQTRKEVNVGMGWWMKEGRNYSHKANVIATVTIWCERREV